MQNYGLLITTHLTLQTLSFEIVFYSRNETYEFFSDRSSSHMYAERCRMFFIKRILDEFALIRKFLRLSSAGMNSWNLSEKLTIGLELQPGDENCSINEHGAIIRNHLYNIKSTLLERSNNWIDNDNETDENLGALSTTGNVLSLYELEEFYVKYFTIISRNLGFSMILARRGLFQVMQ